MDLLETRAVKYSIQFLGVLWCTLGWSIDVFAQEQSPKPSLEFMFNSEKDLAQLVLSPPEGWFISKNGANGKCLKYSGDLAGKLTDPLGAALQFSSSEIGSFVLEVELMQLPISYEKVTFCVAFGQKDSANYAFAQLSSLADRYTHNLFFQSNDQTVRILEKQEAGIYWGIDTWHRLRVERNLQKQELKVLLNGQLIFQSNDDRLMQPGSIRLGNAGDGFKLDNLRFWLLP